MPRPISKYIHGAKPEEQRRLALMNQLLNEAALRELPLSEGQSILDVGSGLGLFSRAMAEAAGRGARVVAIERSAEQLAKARRLAARDRGKVRVDFRQGDALDLPLSESEWGTFDLAHARFLLEHVPDPLAVVRKMVRAVRPGGRIVLADDDHDVLRLWPEPPGFLPLWQAYIRTYDRLGNDPFVGRRLVSLLHQAGARPRRNTWVFFGSCAGNASFPGVVQNMVQILEGAREAILATAGLDRPWFDQGLHSIRAWARRPDAAVWFALCWAEGVRRD